MCQLHKAHPRLFIAAGCGCGVIGAGADAKAKTLPGLNSFPPMGPEVVELVSGITLARSSFDSGLAPVNLALLLGVLGALAPSSFCSSKRRDHVVRRETGWRGRTLELRLIRRGRRGSEGRLATKLDSRGSRRGCRNPTGLAHALRAWGELAHALRAWE
jgi:hypothetical protein